MLSDSDLEEEAVSVVALLDKTFAFKKGQVLTCPVLADSRVPDDFREEHFLELLRCEVVLLAEELENLSMRKPELGVTLDSGEECVCGRGPGFSEESAAVGFQAGIENAEDAVAAGDELVEACLNSGELEQNVLRLCRFYPNHLR